MTVSWDLLSPIFHPIAPSGDIRDVLECYRFFVEVFLFDDDFLVLATPGSRDILVLLALRRLHSGVKLASCCKQGWNQWGIDTILPSVGRSRILLYSKNSFDSRELFNWFIQTSSFSNSLTIYFLSKNGPNVILNIKSEFFDAITNFSILIFLVDSAVSQATGVVYHCV